MVGKLESVEARPRRRGVRIVFRQARESTHSIGENIKVMENKLPHSFRKRTRVRRHAVELENVGVAIHKHRLQASNNTDKNK